MAKSNDLFKRVAEAAQLTVDQKGELSTNDRSLWSKSANPHAVEGLVRQIQSLHHELGLEFDGLQYMGISTTLPEPQQVLDLFNQIEDLQAQAQQKRAA